LNELKALRSENEALRNSHSSVPSESLNIYQLKISELQTELENKEKRMSRLKQVLNARVQEFREAICSILGFKVDLLPHGSFKLASIYAPNRTFEFDARGSLVMGGDISDLQEGISTYLEKEHVPAFMAWVTLHFFQTPE